MKKSAIVYLLFLFLLTSCGAKKNVTTNVEETTTSTPNQIIPDKDAWLDTIQINASAIPSEVIGNYVLEYYEENGNNIYPIEARYDSLVLTSGGYYAFYKQYKVIDSGKYFVEQIDTLRSCYIPSLGKTPRDAVHHVSTGG